MNDWTVSSLFELLNPDICESVCILRRLYYIARRDRGRFRSPFVTLFGSVLVCQREAEMSLHFRFHTAPAKLALPLR